MRMTLFTANCSGIEANCSYPNRAEVCSALELAEAVGKDHVCAEYKGDYRSNGNFICSNVLPMDVDNDHTDDPADYITPEVMGDMFPDIEFVLIPSRHNLLPKGSRPAAPRFHVMFPIKMCSDASEYAAMKVALQRDFPFFDDNALDAGRFFYGSEVEADDICWHDGWLTIDETIDTVHSTNNTEDNFDSYGPILEGSRNNTMSRFAGRVLKRYGDSEKAYEAFLHHSEKCDPPLDSDELSKIWQSARKFYKRTVESQEGYVPPEEYNADFDEVCLKPSDYSDIGEAKVLVREYENELKYTAATDYLRFDGYCWREDKQLAIGAALEFMDLQLADAQDELERCTQALMSIGIPEETVKAGGKSLKESVPEDNLGLLYAFLAALAYLKFVMKRRDYKYITATLNTAKPLLSTDVSLLDSDPKLLNTPEATYDISKGIEGKRPHDPADLITKITNYSPGNDGMDIWLNALDTFFCGDKDLIDYVQQVAGIAAVGEVNREEMIIAYGGGANGKSTFWNAIFRVMGNYAGKISAETLTMACRRNVKPEMAELKGKRLIIASEMEEGMRLNTSVVKQLCSTDEIMAEKKYKDPFHFVPSHTLVLYTNHLPKVGANDDGIWRRLIVIPFNAKITGKSDIKNYADYLVEHAGPAILTWIIEGAKTVISAGYHMDRPKVVEDAIEAYRSDNDWLQHFIEERCDVDPSYSEKSGELYQAYRAYCAQACEFTRSTTDFYSALEKAGYEKRRTNSTRLVYGLKLKSGQDFLE